MKLRKVKTLALFVGVCMVMTLCMGGCVTAVEATTTHVEYGYISQDGADLYFISVPDGPEVEIKLSWEEPMHEVTDLDFAVFGYGWMGGTLKNPEIAYLSSIVGPTDIGIYVYGFYVPGDGVEYCLEVTYGSGVIPDPYAEPGGLTVGDLTSFHVASRMSIDVADKQAALNWITESNPMRQTIFPFMSWNWYGMLYEGSGWAGPAYYAGDPLLVGGMAYSWSMDEYTKKEAQAEMEATTIEYFIDGIPLEELGHATEKLLRADMEAREWYWRFPAAIFKPGELYEALPYRADGLHTFEAYWDGGLWFMGDFYLLW